MKKLAFVVGLRRVYDVFKDQFKQAEEAPYWELFRFLKTLGFSHFVDQLVTAVTMYPRSLDLCRDNLNDLAYGMYSTLGIGRFYLSHHDQNRLTDLILNAGEEIITTLVAHSYYIAEHHQDRCRRGTIEYETELLAIPSVKRIGEFTFYIEISENDESKDEGPSLSLLPTTLGLEGPSIRGY